VEVAELLDLVRIRSVAVRARNLENRRQPLQLRVAEEDAHAFGDLTLAEVRMTVAVRVERRAGVVHVECPQSIEANALLDLVHADVQRRAVRHVDARDPEVAGVEADAEPRVSIEAVHEDCELVHGAADRPAGPG